ncbi:DUF6192 family protein [Streptomyces mirabilis]|uniref:DUF6192 family protein n=1 Tax=Streptomyces mirabilis TaxID=68239 RepID=UPI0036E083DB
MEIYADDLGLSLSTVRSYRFAAAGQRADRPEAPAQKVAAIHRLSDDDEVAAQTATAVLRRPGVAAKVVADDTACTTFRPSAGWPPAPPGETQERVCRLNFPHAHTWFVRYSPMHGGDRPMM